MNIQENSVEEVKELKIKEDSNVYQELAVVLTPYRTRPACSIEFIVEGTKEKPIIGIRYPGRKVINRLKAGKLKSIRKNSAEWANLLDFLVIPYVDGKEAREQEFTFEKMLRDFQENKRDNEEFWELIEKLYNDNEISGNIPKLPGIDTKLYLLALKWIWVQEDVNYKLSCEDVKSPIRYVLETRTGTRTSKGAGRGKFYAVFVLLKHHFTFDEVKKIIPLY